MKFKLFYEIACYAYAHGLRELIQKAIDDPDSDWDDVALSILDKIFNYSQ